MFIYPVLAAILGSGELIIVRLFFTKFSARARDYLTSSFLIVVLIFTLFVPIFYQNPSFLSNKTSLMYFVAILFTAILGNLFHLKAVQSDQITNLEPFRIFEPLMGIVIAFLFFREEVTLLNASLLIAATAGLAISQNSLKHFRLQKSSQYILISITLFALEPFLLKEILDDLNPFMMYYVRAVFILLVLYVFLRPKIILFEKEKTGYITVENIMTAAKKVLLYFSYIHLGVLGTLLIEKIRYPLEYLLARVVLKEKLKFRNIAGSIVIYISVILYTIFS